LWRPRKLRPKTCLPSEGGTLDREPLDWGLVGAGGGFLGFPREWRGNFCLADIFAGARVLALPKLFSISFLRKKNHRGPIGPHDHSRVRTKVAYRTKAGGMIAIRTKKPRAGGGERGQPGRIRNSVAVGGPNSDVGPLMMKGLAVVGGAGPGEKPGPNTRLFIRGQSFAAMREIEALESGPNCLFEPAGNLATLVVPRLSSYFQTRPPLRGGGNRPKLLLTTVCFRPMYLGKTKRVLAGPSGARTNQWPEAIWRGGAPSAPLLPAERGPSRGAGIPIAD